MNNVKSALLAIAVLGAISSVAVAGEQHKIPEACQADAAKLCPGMTPGDHKFGPCMHQHMTEVSGACKAVTEAYREQLRGDRIANPRRPGGPAAGINS